MGSDPVVRAVGPERQASIRRSIRARSAVRWLVWWATTGVALFLWLIMSVSAADADRVIRSAPRHDVAITRVDDDALSYFVRIDGREVELSDIAPIFDVRDVWTFFSFDGYRVGERVTVVVDPADDDWVYDVDAYRPFSWWAAAFGLGFLTGIAGVLRGLFTRRWLLPDASRWSLVRRGRVAQATIRDVRGPQPAPGWVHLIERLRRRWRDGPHSRRDYEQLVIEVEGRTLYWEVRTAQPVVVEPGTVIAVWGRPRRRGWLVGLTEPEPLIPRGRLD
jgi:hypothetical protein